MCNSTYLYYIVLYYLLLKATSWCMLISRPDLTNSALYVHAIVCNLQLKFI